MRSRKEHVNNTIPTFLEPVTPFDVYIVDYLKRLLWTKLEWSDLTIAHSSSTTRSFSGPSFADFNMHHPPSSESITSISRVEAEAQAARFRWFNPSLTVTTLSVVIVKNEWWCSHGGLSAKKCDCGDWTCGLAICVGWEMNQSLIYEVTQHSLPSVLAQFSSLQSHPAQQVALWTW